MTMVTDMHCHLLPGVDDGPETMQDTLDLLAEVSRQGVDCMIATSHYHPGRYVVDGMTLIKTLWEVRRECKKAGISLKLLPGQECYWFSGLVEALDAGNALTMNNTRMVLVEFDPDVAYSTIVNALRTLVNNGYEPIVAHFERYQCLNGQTDKLEELKNLGAYLQMNFDRLLERPGIFGKNVWRQYLAQGYVDFLGSDTHGMKFRPPHIAEAVKWMHKNVEEETCRRVLERNMELILAGTDR